MSKAFDLFTFIAVLMLVLVAAALVNLALLWPSKPRSGVSYHDATQRHTL